MLERQLQVPKRQPRLIDFSRDDVGQVIDAMAAIRQATGKKASGWINLAPQVDPEDEPPPPSGPALVFGSPIHEVPVCTWVPGAASRHGPGPDSLGVQHATGTRAFARLVSLGVELPSQWRRVQDHPRRGLVVLAPAGSDLSDELDWLLRSGEALSLVPTTGGWRAEVRQH